MGDMAKAGPPETPEKRESVLKRVRRRSVPEKTRLLLYVRAGGRCEFDGCNRDLLEHHLTGETGNFAQVAHICAFSHRGPRGDEGRAAMDTHDLANLMLLCPECHKLVDDRPEVYTVDVLRKHKKAHEDRIRMLTATKPDRHTVAVLLMAQIGGRQVAISLREMQTAVTPRFLGERDVVTIDLTDIPDQPNFAYWQNAASAIKTKVAGVYEQSFSQGPARHVSVFALAPIPLLVFLGSCLSDKVPLTLYQRHRDTEDWRWKEDGPVIAFRRAIIERRKGQEAALLLSLSGRITTNDLPPVDDSDFSVYEIAPQGQERTPMLLRTEATLHAFRSGFQGMMRQIVAEHPNLRRLHIFPAVPAPVAVAIGRDLMPKRDPAVLIYDYDKRVGGFVPTLEVNNHETR